MLVAVGRLELSSSTPSGICVSVFMLGYAGLRFVLNSSQAMGEMQPSTVSPHVGGTSKTDHSIVQFWRSLLHYRFRQRTLE